MDVISVDGSLFSLVSKLKGTEIINLWKALMSPHISNTVIHAIRNRHRLYFSVLSCMPLVVDFSPVISGKSTPRLEYQKA